MEYFAEDPDEDLGNTELVEDMLADAGISAEEGTVVCTHVHPGSSQC